MKAHRVKFNVGERGADSLIIGMTTATGQSMLSPMEQDGDEVVVTFVSARAEVRYRFRTMSEFFAALESKGARKEEVRR